MYLLYCTFSLLFNCIIILFTICTFALNSGQSHLYLHILLLLLLWLRCLYTSILSRFLTVRWDTATIQFLCRNQYVFLNLNTDSKNSQCTCNSATLLHERQQLQSTDLDLVLAAVRWAECSHAWIQKKFLRLFVATDNNTRWQRVDPCLNVFIWLVFAHA